MKTTLLTLTATLGFAFPAMADQCAWINRTDSQSAIQLINLHKEVMHFCQNCGDGKPSFIDRIDSAQTAQAEMQGQKYPYRTVILKAGDEQTSVDLAYLYVRTASNIFANVAHLVGCPSEGAVTFIQTTNTNQKIQHFYDATGTRVNTATTSAKLETQFGNRKPASKK